MTEGAKIGKQIKALRKQSKCTQEEVANELYISQSYLRKIEHGEANPSVNMVGKIMDFLKQKIAQAETKEHTRQKQ